MVTPVFQNSREESVSQTHRHRERDRETDRQVAFPHLWHCDVSSLAGRGGVEEEEGESQRRRGQCGGSRSLDPPLRDKHTDC